MPSCRLEIECLQWVFLDKELNFEGFLLAGPSWDLHWNSPILGGKDCLPGAGHLAVGYSPLPSGSSCVSLSGLNDTTGCTATDTHAQVRKLTAHSPLLFVRNTEFWSPPFHLKMLVPGHET